MKENKHNTEVTDIKKNSKQREDKPKVPITWKRVKNIIFHIWRQFDDPYYSGFAAQIAYYFFMSSIPTLIVLTQVLGIFDVSMDFVRDWLDEHLSTQMSKFLEDLLTASSTTVTNLIMVILALWASSAFAFSLSRLTTYTISYGKYRFNFFTERARVIPTALLSILVIAFSLIVYVYGEVIALSVFKSELVLQLVSAAKTPILALLFFAMILSNYYILPRIRVPVSAVIPGAIVATVGIMIVTWVYSLYTANALGYNVLYGAFSSIIAMMLWFYLISWVLCIGMMFNKSWDIHLKRGRLTPEKIKEYMLNQYGDNGEKMYNKLMMGEYDKIDRRLDSIAVKMSRKYDPGYQEKREKEISVLKQERDIKKKVEQELKK